MKLFNASKNQILINNLQRADSLFARMKGLLGRESIDEQEALLISHCTSIHTFFMNFTIDVVFVDRKMKVIKTYAYVKPWKLIWPVWRASSVIELHEGALARTKIEVGDQLHVVN